VLGRSADQRAGAFFVLWRRDAYRAEVEAANLASRLRAACAGELIRSSARARLRHRIVDAELDPPTVDDTETQPERRQARQHGEGRD
jgi:hypothetical protein